MLQISAGSRLLAVLLVLCCAPALLGDTVWIGSDPNKLLERKNMRIEGMVGDGLLFRSATADRAAEPRPIKDIWRIEVDDEPALNSGEAAFAAGKWDQAVGAYQKAMNASRKDWVKQYASLRLIAAAEKSGKFSAAAAGYAALVHRDPKAAAKAKPAIPKDAKAELPAAINSVKAASSDPKLSDLQRNLLKAFLIELYIANDQLNEAQALGANAAPPLGAKTDAGPAAAAPGRGQVELKLQLAIASLKQKNYAEAIEAIDSVSSALTEPRQQAAALFTLAEAKAGLARNDPAKLKDAALAYMRVVAHFKHEPDIAQVPEALLKTGAVLEQAKVLSDALSAYEAVQNEYKDTPHARQAAAGAARVRKAIEEAKG